jgi:hypothetical protein
MSRTNDRGHWRLVFFGELLEFLGRLGQTALT